MHPFNRCLPSRALNEASDTTVVRTHLLFGSERPFCSLLSLTSASTGASKVIAHTERPGTRCHARPAAREEFWGSIFNPAAQATRDIVAHPESLRAFCLLPKAERTQAAWQQTHAFKAAAKGAVLDRLTGSSRTLAALRLLKRRDSQMAVLPIKEVNRWVTRVTALRRKLLAAADTEKPMTSPNAAQLEAIAFLFERWRTWVRAASADALGYARPLKLLLAEGLSIAFYDARVGYPARANSGKWGSIAEKPAPLLARSAAKKPITWRFNKSDNKTRKQIDKACTHYFPWAKGRTINRVKEGLVDPVRLRFGGQAQTCYQPGPIELLEVPYGLAVNAARVATFSSILGALRKRKYAIKPKHAVTLLRTKAKFCGKEAYLFPPAFYVALAQHAQTTYLNDTPLHAFDPCAGWGDRLYAAIYLRSLGVLSDYHACDPNTAMQSVYQSIVNEACDFFHIPERDAFSVEPAPLEEADLDAYARGKRSRPNFIFTSPPYGTDHGKPVEMYSVDADQSWQRYRTLADWTSGFLRTFVLRYANVLAPGGVFAVNITDTANHVGVCKSLLAFAREAGLNFREVIGMENRGSYQCEPIFVFTKPTVPNAPEAPAKSRRCRRRRKRKRDVDDAALPDPKRVCRETSPEES